MKKYHSLPSQLKKPMHKPKQASLIEGRLGLEINDDEWMKEYKTRWLLLFQYYKAESWTDLAFKACEDLIPGLRTPRRGRPKSIGIEPALYELCKEYNALILKNPKLTDREAAEAIFKKWKNQKPNHILANKPADHLRRKLPNARKCFQDTNFEQGIKNLILALKVE